MTSDIARLFIHNHFLLPPHDPGLFHMLQTFLPNPLLPRELFGITESLRDGAVDLTSNCISRSLRTNHRIAKCGNLVGSREVQATGG